MKSFFDELGNKFQDVAKKSSDVAQAAARKSGDMLEITKLSLQLKDNEKQIEEKYKEIGRLVYEGIPDIESLPDEIKLMISDIHAIKESNMKLSDMIESLKNGEA